MVICAADKVWQAVASLVYIPIRAIYEKVAHELYSSQWEKMRVKEEVGRRGDRQSKGEEKTDG